MFYNYEKKKSAEINVFLFNKKNPVLITIIMSLIRESILYMVIFSSSTTTYKYY